MYSLDTCIYFCFFVHPSKEYLGYIDFRSLGILWGLMVIIQGFKENAVFEKIAGVLLSKVKNGWQLSAVLIFMCFLGSMLITNDVALVYARQPFILCFLSTHTDVPEFERFIRQTSYELFMECGGAL